MLIELTFSFQLLFNEKLILCFLLFYCCDASSENDAAIVDGRLGLSTIIGKIKQTRYSNTQQAKALAIETLNTSLSRDNIKQQIQISKIIGELEIVLANNVAAIDYGSTALSLKKSLTDHVY